MGVVLSGIRTSWQDRKPTKSEGSVASKGERESRSVLNKRGRILIGKGRED